MNTTIAPEHLAAIAVLAAHRASPDRSVGLGLTRGAGQVAAGTVFVAVVLGVVVLSAIAGAMSKVAALIRDFLSLAGTMASVLLTIVVVILGAGVLLIHHH
ncbi:MAG TPA: hypothetical protein VFI65_09290 [Streptosporangiaceae bacterium]|nr:hypothetical protein [Streptosporangiaceae bacterium]